MEKAEQDQAIEIAPSVIAGRYELVSKLGEGGMGTVYLVRHVNTNEQLAMKVLRKELVGNAEAVERFKREMKASAILKSDNVTRITDADTAQELDGSLYMVMELLDGVDIEKLVHGKKPLDAESVVFILGQAARALDKAHELKIIHRDLKPENLYLHRSADVGLVVKVLDFGIAMFKAPVGSTDMRLTQDQTVLGTPLYMAPEQIQGLREQISPQTDIWAIGMIAFDMLAGRSYWQVPTFSVLVSNLVLGKQPPPSSLVPSLPPAFDAWFAKSCAMDCAARFGSVLEQLESLTVALEVDAAWLESTAAPQGLIDRVNETSPPRVSSARLRTSSTQGLARSRTGNTTARSARAESAPAKTQTSLPADAEKSSRRKWLVLLLLLLILLAGGGVLFRRSGVPGGVTSQTPIGVVQSSNTPSSSPKESAPSGTPEARVRDGKPEAKAAPPDTDDSALAKGSSSRPRIKSDSKPPRRVDPKRRAIDYDPVAP